MMIQNGQGAISISKDNNPYSENYGKYTGSLQFGYVSEKAFYYPDPGVVYVPERDLNSHNPRKYHLYNPINMIKFSGIKFRRYVKK